MDENIARQKELERDMREALAQHWANISVTPRTVMLLL